MEPFEGHKMRETFLRSRDFALLVRYPASKTSKWDHALDKNSIPDDASIKVASFGR